MNRNEILSEELNKKQQAILWRQRLFEAESGLNKYLIELKGGVFFDEWIQIKKEIYESIPTSFEPTLWKKAFFNAQALMEKFVVNHFGHDDIELWANFNATIHMIVEIPRLPGPLGPLERFRQQLELYQSEMKFFQIDQNRATLNITRCGIWKYRELARSNGVVITLKSPCEYCTVATNANITAKGYKADFELLDTNGVRGCSWTVQNSL